MVRCRYPCLSLSVKLVLSFPKIVENKNIKRESKTYSYKEQMLGMELRKELEEKKKLKDTGGVEGPGGEKASRMPTNLTKKQKETIDQELEKEAQIRTKMTEVILTKIRYQHSMLERRRVVCCLPRHIQNSLD